jgi:hypothetical protein
MTPIALQGRDILPEDYDLFLTMRQIFEALPDLSGEPVVSCHMVTRAFAAHFPVEVVDGHFGRGSHHSWLVLRDLRPDGLVIVDIYPVAGASPFLVYAYWITSWAKLYIPDPTVVEGIIDEAFSKRVALLSKAVGDLKTGGETISPP